MADSCDVIHRRFFALVLVKRLRGLDPLGGALLGRLLCQYQALVHILQGCSSLERGFRLISSHLVLYQVLVLLVPRNAHNVFTTSATLPIDCVPAHSRLLHKYGAILVASRCNSV